MAFNEGKTELAANGLPATCHFGLSTKSVDGTSAYAAGNTLASSGEIAGTGYTRKAESEPVPVNGLVQWAQKQWQTGAAADWPAATRSCFLATSGDNSGKLLCAWNLQPGGVARDLSQPNTTENFTPSLQVG